MVAIARKKMAHDINWGIRKLVSLLLLFGEKKVEIDEERLPVTASGLGLPSALTCCPLKGL